MSAPGEVCELCDMPLAYCPHGQPAPATAPSAAPSAPRRAKAPTRPKASKPTTRTAQPSVTSRAAARRWSPPELLAPVILEVLHEAGGELDTDSALAAIEERFAERMGPGDRDSTPTGEQRWQLAARKARQQLIREGLMVKDQPGAWTLGNRTLGNR